MEQMVHRFTTALVHDDVAYQVEAWGAPHDGDLWQGWLVFSTADGRIVRATGRETIQSNLGALVYWATGLESVYLEGAFGRSRSAVEASPRLSTGSA